MRKGGRLVGRDNILFPVSKDNCSKSRSVLQIELLRRDFAAQLAPVGELSF